MAADELVGRDVAVARLRAAVESAVAGRGGLVLVAGEAGIGKTALVSRVVERIAAGGDARVLWATCWDGPGAPAYWPWMQVVRSHVRACDPAMLRARLGAGAGEVARLIGDPGELSEFAGHVRDPDRARFRLFDAVSSFLIRAAADRPLCVVLDDLQWADASSLRLLGFLARQLSTSSLLVIGCYRDTEIGQDHPLGALRGHVAADAELIELAGLDPSQVARLIADIGGVDVGSDLVAEVFRRTAGNPFFVREVIRLMAARGTLNQAGGRRAGIPDGVRHVVEHRLARLPQACATLLAVAAVLGQEVNSAVLARSTRFAAGTVAELIEVMVRAGVLNASQDASGRYRFGHDLFRETVYDGLALPDRARLHRQVGVALEELRGDGADIGAAELAHHFLLAAVGSGERADPVGDTALQYCVAAAADASNRLAYEDAVGHYRRALDGLGEAGMLSEQATLELLLGRADALRRAGEMTVARTDYQRAIRLARRSRRPAQLARAALGVHALGVESGASRDGCVGLLEEALGLLPDEAGALKAQVLAGLAREVYLSRVDERARAARMSGAAVEIARQVGDDATLAMCLLAAHDTIWLPGTARQRRVIATEMAAAAHRAGDRAFEAEAWLLRASAGLELGDPVALVDLDEFVRLGTAVGQAHHSYLVLTRRATLATLAGDFAQAQRLITEAGELAESIGEPDAWNVQTRLWWELRSAQGRRVEVEARLRSCTLPQLRFWYQALTGMILLERGEHAEAAAAIAPAVQIRPEQLPFNYVVGAQWAELGEAAAALGMLEACRRYYDALLPHTGTAVVIAAAVGFGGAVDHHLGVLAAALGRIDDALGHFERAAQMHEGLGARPWLARTRIEWAAALHHRGLPADRAQVGELIAQARSVAVELEMTHILRRAEQLAQRPVSTFRRVGDVWTLSYAGTQVQLKDAKGLRDIAALLAAPGRDIPATGLLGAGNADGRAPGSGFGADPVLDAAARQRYRVRLAQLDETLADADRDNFPARSAAAQAERDVLIRELKAAVGLGGRARRLGDDAERARKAVTARIRDSIARIDARHPVLGTHLRESITTGLFCRYAPAEPPLWRT